MADDCIKVADGVSKKEETSAGTGQRYIWSETWVSAGGNGGRAVANLRQAKLFGH